jgi:tRNA 2-thiouridine synthesizing protein B
MLYLVDKPMADIAFRTAAGDPDARIVLIQDGVLLQPDLDVPVYAVARDVSVRGVDLDPEIQSIDYDTLIQMVFEQETKNFV